MKKLILFNAMVLSFLFAFSQKSEQEVRKQKELKASDNLVAEANEELNENKFIEAETTYRKAISKSGANAHAKYNLGNAYYENESYSEAFTRYKQAGEVAETKEQKHKAYHNMGNVFMNEKAYEKAVAAYKEALRNNPTDDETRYNLALAKEMLKKQQNENKDKKDDQKEDKDKKKEDQKKEDKKDENKDKGENDKKKEGDKEDKKEQDPNKDGEKEKKKNENKNQGEPKDEKGEAKPRPNQLSPQQVKNILEAMANEEKKVQEKLNAQKIKGTPRRTEKDW